MSIELLSHNNDDILIVNTARVSFSKESKRDENGEIDNKDKRLIKYLINHKHKSPFFHPKVITNRVLHQRDFIKWAVHTQQQQFHRKITYIDPYDGMVEFKEAGSVWAYLEAGELPYFCFVNGKLKETVQAYKEWSNYSLYIDTRSVDISDQKYDPEFIYVTLRIKMPIAISRQWFKHGIGFARNEVSRRYVDYEPEFFAPDAWRKRAQDKKQGSSEETIPLDDISIENPLAIKMLKLIDHNKNSALVTALKDKGFTKISYTDLLDINKDWYSNAINKEACPEQARFSLVQSMYTEFIETASLYDYARLYLLRSSELAQKEIRDYADQVGEILSKEYPEQWKLALKLRSIH